MVLSCGIEQVSSRNQKMQPLHKQKLSSTAIVLSKLLIRHHIKQKRGSLNMIRWANGNNQ